VRLSFLVIYTIDAPSLFSQVALTTERYEEAKEELKKTMTVKMMKKKEQVTMKLQKKAQQETATLVHKHAQQMLELLQSKQEELQKELEEEIMVSDKLTPPMHCQSIGTPCWIFW